jgi:dihydroorotase
MSLRQAQQRIGIGAMQVPPLRSDEDVAGMRERVEDGRIDMFMSHHAPHRMADKYSDDPVPGEFTPKAGYSSIDITYPLLLTHFGVPIACRTYCEAPANHLGLKKGRIAVGYDADLVVVEHDPGRVHENIHVTGKLAPRIWRVDPPSLFFSKGHVTPFWGERLTYLVMKTFLRGQEVFDRETDNFQRVDIRHIA